MGATMTAEGISEAWLEYVNGTLMLGKGYERPDVDAELKRLDERGELRQVREEMRTAIDALIDEILNTPPESRREMYNKTDRVSLAMLQDRVQCGTQFLISMVQQGVQFKNEEAQTLTDFFRQMLLQKQEQ